MADTTSAAPSPLPCPFCGSEHLARNCITPDDVACLDCDALAPSHIAWNRRAPQPVAREPLSDEQIEDAWNDLQKRRATESLKNFDARIGMQCHKCGHGTYQADSNGYNSFHRCDRCQHVPMWCAEGTELLAHGLTPP